MSILNVNQIQPLGGGSTITVSANDVNFSGNISIGSSFVGTASTASLATSAQGLTGTPDITVGNIQSGVVTATTFIGDGSGLTGVTASGSGINIKDSGSTVGVAATVNFDTNLNVSPASAGIVTVTVGDTDFAIADKIIHTGDTNTAIRFPAADTITAETAGSERLRIDSNGHMGLGVSPNANWPTNNDFKALQIGTGIAVFGRGSGDEDRGGISANYYHTGSAEKYIGNGHAGRMYFEDGSIVFSNAAQNSSGAGAAMSLNERLRITSAGGVLIGGHTSAVDVGNAPNIEIVNTSTSTLTLARNDTSIASGNDIAAIRVWGNDSNGTYQQCAEILAEADGDHGTGDKPTALAFKVTADGASSPTERFRIKSDGKVGIGTDNVDYKLEVFGAPGADGDFSIKSSASAAGGTEHSKLRFRVRNASNQESTKASIHVESAANWGGNLIFGTKTASGGLSESTVERLRIDSSGRVGINTNTFNDAAEALRVQAPSGQSNTHLTIKAGSTSGYSVLNFGDNDFNEGRIKYDHSSNTMEFFADDAGFMKYEDDNTVGGGRFSLTSNGTYLTANTVDYYLNAGTSRTYGVYVHKNGTGTYGIYCYTYGGNSTQYSIGGQADTTSTYSSGGVLGYSINSNTYGILGYWSTSAYYTLYGNGVSLCTGGHTTSDARLKDVQSGIGTGILDKVCSLEAKKYTWKENTQQRRSVGVGTQIGLLAQDVLEHFPEVVMEHENPEIAGHNPETLNEQIGTTYSIDYGKMTAVLIEAIKDLKAENNALAARVAALEGS